MPKKRPKKKKKATDENNKSYLSNSSTHSARTLSTSYLDKLHRHKTLKKINGPVLSSLAQIRNRSDSRRKDVISKNLSLDKMLGINKLKDTL